MSSPVFYENCLQDFDPRVRPWYIGASTGVKNTIVFFKIKTYLKRAKETAKYLVNITNIGDRASLVDLNNCQGTCSYIAKLGT